MLEQQGGKLNKNLTSGERQHALSVHLRPSCGQRSANWAGAGHGGTAGVRFSPIRSPVMSRTPLKWGSWEGDCCDERHILSPCAVQGDLRTLWAALSMDQEEHCGSWSRGSGARRAYVRGSSRASAGSSFFLPDVWNQWKQHAVHITLPHPLTPLASLVRRPGLENNERLFQEAWESPDFSKPCCLEHLSALLTAQKQGIIMRTKVLLQSSNRYIFFWKEKNALLLYRSWFYNQKPR